MLGLKHRYQFIIVHIIDQFLSYDYVRQHEVVELSFQQAADFQITNS